MFPTKFSYRKEILGDPGVMNITPKPYAKLVNHGPYRLNSKYKEKVNLELDKMITTMIIELVNESELVSPMVVQEKKKKGEIRICVDLRKLNDACLHNAFPVAFTNEVLDNVGGQETYSFIARFLGYRHIIVAPEYRHSTTFAI